MNHKAQIGMHAALGSLSTFNYGGQQVWRMYMVEGWRNWCMDRKGKKKPPQGSEMTVDTIPKKNNEPWLKLFLEKTY